MPPQTAPALTVAQLARAVGVAPDTVRYYERVGLLPPPARTASDHRRYDETAADRLRFIQGAQRLGLRLREIRTLLEVRDTGTCPCEPAEELLSQRIAEVDAELVRLQALRHELTAIVGQIQAAVDPSTDAACPDPAPGTWCPPGSAEGR